ncbi:hypothetical protein GQ472_01575 [archaeon]|nr:hypothetical protein [archaeon]
MISDEVKGEVNELHRRFCFHCRKDLVFQGYQVGRFIGIDKITVICPECGGETGCFRSQEDINSKRASMLVLDSDMAKVKRFPSLYRGKRQDDWKRRVYGIPDIKRETKDGSIMDYRHKGMSAFKCGGGDDEDSGAGLDKDLDDYDDDDDDERGVC